MKFVIIQFLVHIRSCRRGSEKINQLLKNNKKRKFQQIEKNSFENNLLSNNSNQIKQQKQIQTNEVKK
jgi:hypothetical protein